MNGGERKREIFSEPVTQKYVGRAAVVINSALRQTAVPEESTNCPLPERFPAPFKEEGKKKSRKKNDSHDKPAFVGSRGTRNHNAVAPFAPDAGAAGPGSCSD